MTIAEMSDSLLRTRLRNVQAKLETAFAKLDRAPVGGVEQSRWQDRLEALEDHEFALLAEVRRRGMLERPQGCDTRAK